MSVITRALREQLSTALELSEKFGNGVRVESAEPVNESPERCPWIGVYKQTQSLPSRTLGTGTGSRHQRVSVLVLMQETSSQSGQDCEDRLNVLVNESLTAILDDESLGGTVMTIEEIDVTYTDFRREGAAFLQEAVLSLSAMAQVTVV
jgi:hypothetical protein